LKNNFNTFFISLFFTTFFAEICLEVMMSKKYISYEKKRYESKGRGLPPPELLMEVWLKDFR